MAEKQERHYNINWLNFLFAVASIVLLAAIIFMFADDYRREWKGCQSEFRKLDIQKTRQKLAEESEKLKGNSEYQDLSAKIGQADQTLKSKSGELKALQAQGSRLKAQSDLANQNYQFARAEFDAARYAYEEAAAHISPGTEAAKAKFARLTTQVGELKTKVEQAQDELKSHQAQIDQFRADIKELERAKKKIEKELDIFLAKLEKIDPKQMSFANKIANSLRDLPVLDLMNPNYKIQQIVIKDVTDDVNFMRVPKVDRCITCHLGIANPEFKDAPQPFATHPNLELFLSSDSAHPMEEFGCTSCHQGRGRGVDFVSAAHMPGSEEQAKEWKKTHQWQEFHYWETQMYPKPYTEAGCFKCHSNETVIKGAEKLNLGLNLIERAGCFGCHLIEKYKNREKVGPDLNHIGSKSNKEWVYQWIADPKSFRHNSWMPAFFGQSNNNDPQSQARAQQEIHAVTHYLFEHDTEYKLAEVPLAGDVKKGEELVSSLGCFGCHSIEPQPTNEKIDRQKLLRQHGPNLIGLGTKTDKKWLYNWLKNPQGYHARTRMPDLRLSDQEASDLAAYLAADQKPDFMKTAPAVSEEILNKIAEDFLSAQMTASEVRKELQGMSAEQKLDFTGRKLIKHYGCYACHNIAGFENEKPIGTELTEEGSKTVHDLDFGFVPIPHDKYAWFSQKLKNPRIFDESRVRAPLEKLRMPNYRFSDDEIEAIVTALLGFVKDTPQSSKLKPRTPENIFIEEGQKLVREFNCQGCHIIEGEGGAIQPTVTGWLVDFDGRAESDAKAMTMSFSPPNLIGEGAKVQTGWLFDFIHNPVTIRPWLKARMPTFALHSEEINTFLKYFSALDGEKFPFTDVHHAAMTLEDHQAAEKLFSSNYFDCAKCHIVGDQMPAGSPDSWAPDFALAKTRLKPEWIIEWLKNPQALQPGTKMPTFFDPAYFDSTGPDDVLSGDENAQIKVLRDYLLTLTGKQPPAAAPAEPQAEAVATQTPVPQPGPAEQ